jgi:hypothetical protein
VFIKSLLLGVAMVCISISSSVFSLPAIIENLKSQPISLDRKEPFFVYVSYGDPASNTTYDQMFISVKISTPSLNFVSNNLFELIKKDAGTLTCSDTNSKESRPITYDLVNEGGLQYGPQSAETSTQPSGRKINTLKPKQTGCLKLGLKVMPVANEGDEVAITIKQQYIGKDGEVIPLNDIPDKTILFSIGAAANCAQDQTSVGTKCIASCSDVQYLDVSGVCQNKAQQCSDTTELLGENCVPKCQSNQARNTFGECKNTSQDYSTLTSTIITIVLLLVGAIVGTIIISGVYRIVSKKL